MEPIQIAGIDELKPEEIPEVNKLVNEYHEKIQRELSNITSLQVHIKCYQKDGEKRKFSIHAKAVAPTQIFASTKAQDWDLKRTLHKCFKDLERQIRHRLKTDDQKPKSYTNR